MGTSPGRADGGEFFCVETASSPDPWLAELSKVSDEVEEDFFGRDRLALLSSTGGAWEGGGGRGDWLRDEEDELSEEERPLLLPPLERLPLSHDLRVGDDDDDDGDVFFDPKSCK